MDTSKQSEAARLVNTGEMARLLGTKPETIAKWAREGVIPCVRIKRRTLRFDPVAVLHALRGGAA